MPRIGTDAPTSRPKSGKPALDGRIVERWGLVAPVPPTPPHDNGAF